MNNDPYSWGNVDRLDRMIKEQKEEFKKKELEYEQSRNTTNDSDKKDSV